MDGEGTNGKALYFTRSTLWGEDRSGSISASTPSPRRAGTLLRRAALAAGAARETRAAEGPGDGNGNRATPVTPISPLSVDNSADLERAPGVPAEVRCEPPGAHRLSGGTWGLWRLAAPDSLDRSLRRFLADLRGRVRSRAAGVTARWPSSRWRTPMPDRRCPSPVAVLRPAHRRRHFKPIRLQLMGLRARSWRTSRRSKQAPALGQCRKLSANELAIAQLVRHRRLRQHVAELGDESVAAIASALAGELYGLKMLKPDVEDEDHNMTRFLIMARQQQAPTPAAGGDQLSSSG